MSTHHNNDNKCARCFRGYKRRFFVRLMLLILTLSVLSCGAMADSVDTSQPLLFLGNHDIPPMIYLPEGGSNAEGLVVDLANAIIKQADLNARVKASDWGTAQEMLKSGSADALLQINSNPEREKIFDFSEPLLLSEFSIFRRSDRVDLKTIESLYGHSIGVESKGYPISLLKKHPEIQSVIIPSWSHGLQQVSRGELDAILVDRWVGEFELSKLNLTNIQISKNPVESSYSKIAVSKGNDALLAKINQGISDIRNNGTYDDILSDWQGSEVVYLTKDERIFYFYVFVLTLLLIVITFGVFYVLRIRKDSQTKSELNRQLEMRNEELLQFAYRTSHDLKSPLTSSKALLRFVQQDLESGRYEEAKKNAAVVEGQMEKLAHLVTSMLEMTTAEFKEIESETIDFTELIDDIQARLAISLDESGCQLIVQDDTERPVRLPAARLIQIIENLVSNGMKYRAPDKNQSRVWVSMENPADCLVLKVEDNGLGIPEEYQSKVFDMFQRVHPRVASGSGLGLNIVQKHVQSLNGSIQLTSKENEGSCFEIRIPL